MMSVQHYCDVCGHQIGRNVVKQRIKESTVVEGTKVGVEITVSIDGTANGGDLCKGCLGRVLAQFVPYPTEADNAQ